MILTLDLPPDIAEALHNLVHETGQDREALALVLLRDALIANGMLEDGDLDEGSDVAGSA